MTTVIQSLGNFPNSVNNERCMARKNQKNDINTQCPNRKKDNNYCGKHRNYDRHHFVRIDQTLPTTTSINIQPVTTNILSTNSTSIDSSLNSSSSNYDNNTLTNQMNNISLDIKNDISQSKLDNIFFNDAGLQINGNSGFSNECLKKNMDGKFDDNILNCKYKIGKYKTSKKSCTHKYYYNKKPSYPLQILDYLISPNMDRSATAIKKTCKHYKLISSKNLKKIDITKMRNIVIRFFETMLDALINIDKVLLLQRNIKQWIKNNKYKINGPAVYNRGLCNNSTDFYSFDSIKDISNDYFFSYKDKDGFIYGFHIESFVQLINESSNSKNPYNREAINNNVKKRARDMWHKLELANKKSNHVIFKESNDIRAIMRNKCLTVFQLIDMFGYQTNINWILRMSLSRLKTIYRSLENYWHYRAGITDEMRANIEPNGDLFSSRGRNQVNRNINKYVVMGVILDVIEKLVSNGITDDDKQMGCIIALMALGDIIPECAHSNPWLV